MYKDRKIKLKKKNIDIKFIKKCQKKKKKKKSKRHFKIERQRIERQRSKN